MIPYKTLIQTNMDRKFIERPFIYRERDDIDAFLNESQLWRDIYDVFLRVKDNTYRLKVPSVTMFNEVRYQCVRIMLDKHPEEDIWGIYLNDARDTLGWRYASDLCFSMVYAVLSLLKNPPVQIPIFCNLLFYKKLNTDIGYFPRFQQLVDSEKAQGVCYDIDLRAMPEKPAIIRNAGEEKQILLNGRLATQFIPKYDYEWWDLQTNHFDQNTIREIVNLWDSKEERCEMIDIIEHAFDLQEQALLTSNDPCADDLPF